MKEMFEKPVMNLILFDYEDIIVTSSCPTKCSGHCVIVCTSDCTVVFNSPSICSNDLT